MKTKASALEYRRNLQNVPFIIYNQSSLSPRFKTICGTVDIYRGLTSFGLSPKYFGTDMMSDEPGYIVQ